jgi:hypothetical protein
MMVLVIAGAALVGFGALVLLNFLNGPEEESRGTAWK